MHAFELCIGAARGAFWLLQVLNSSHSSQNSTDLMQILQCARLETNARV